MRYRKRAQAEVASSAAPSTCRTSPIQLMETSDLAVRSAFPSLLRMRASNSFTTRPQAHQLAEQLLNCPLPNVLFLETGFLVFLTQLALCRVATPICECGARNHQRTGTWSTARGKVRGNNTTSTGFPAEEKARCDRDLGFPRNQSSKLRQTPDNDHYPSIRWTTARDKSRSHHRRRRDVVTEQPRCLQKIGVLQLVRQDRTRLLGRVGEPLGD